MTELKEAISVLHEQVVELLVGENPGGGSVTCALIPDWTVSHDGILIFISGPAQEKSHPKTPPWLEYFHDSENGSFRVKARIDLHLYDYIGLLLEAWRFQNQKPEDDSEHHLRLALAAIANRWKRQGDPISDNDQRGLIGELRCIIHSEKIVGVEAIESWDSTGDALYDLDAESWAIESKSSGNDPESVIISYPEQVDFRIEKTLVLGVTEVRMNMSDGKTLPEIVEEVLDELPAIHGPLLETYLTGRRFMKSESKKYSRKWDVGGTRFLHITEDSEVLPCEIIDGLPSTVKLTKYRLKTESFPSSDLSDLIGT